VCVCVNGGWNCNRKTAKEQKRERERVRKSEREGARQVKRVESERERSNPMLTYEYTAIGCIYSHSQMYIQLAVNTYVIKRFHETHTNICIYSYTHVQCMFIQLYTYTALLVHVHIYVYIFMAVLYTYISMKI